MIEIKNLTAFYDNKKVLDNITADFPQGKLTVILGPNGSGKTTLIKTVTGLMEKKSGEIFIDGKNIESMNIKEIARKVSYLSQTRNVPSITAEKMVLHGRFPHLSWPRHYSKKDWEIVEKSMEKTGCANLKGRLVTELSGGERQKVYLAMALAQDTDIIFMDEPTTYLDPEHQLAVMERACNLCKSGKTVILVLHDLPMALKNGQNIIVMNNGVLMEKGTGEEIYNSGILEKVFHIKVNRTETEYGIHYWIDSENKLLQEES